ncbi:MAG TPA: hypothetical protein VH417_02995 [Vicinamibacterales bacterium]|jgi:hypothetical protein
MSFLYRHALFVSRKQPYIDWANGLEEGAPALDEQLARLERTVFLAFEFDREPALEDLLPDYWEDIFEAELAAWNDDEQRWPSPRTREMFDGWFDVELCRAVYDLDPDEPLSQHDVDARDLTEALTICASCGISVDEGEGRFAGFKVADPDRLALWKGRVLPLEIDKEQLILCLVPSDDDDEFDAEDDVVVRVCSSGCEKGVRKVVPKALRRLLDRMPAEPLPS